VTLGDDVMSVIPDMRDAAQSMLIDEGTISRPGTGSGTIDPVTGDYTPPAGTEVYSGRCRVRHPTAQEQQVVFGDINTTVSRYTVDLPYDAPLVAVGDVFTLTVTADAELVGAAMRVASIIAKSVLIYRQIGLEVIE
jgi:hypothetical protein